MHDCGRSMETPRPTTIVRWLWRGTPNCDTNPLEVLVPNITKAELLDRVVDAADVTKKEAEEVLGAFFQVTVAAAKKGDKVSWPGFGSFEGIKKKASTGRNPQTGEPVKIPARKALKFKASSTMREQLNGKKK